MGFYLVPHSLDLLSGVSNRSWHLAGNPKLVWHPACHINEWRFVDLSMDTLHLNNPLVLFGSEGPALSLPLFLSHALSLFFNNDKGPLNREKNVTEWPDVPICLYALFIFIYLVAM